MHRDPELLEVDSCKAAEVREVVGENWQERSVGLADPMAVVQGTAYSFRGYRKDDQELMGQEGAGIDLFGGNNHLENKS